MKKTVSTDSTPSNIAKIKDLLAKTPTKLEGSSRRLHDEQHRCYDEFSLSELLAYFKFRRTALFRVLASLTEVQCSRTIREAGKNRKETVYWRARAIAMHELEHLSDLERKLSRR